MDIGKQIEGHITRLLKNSIIKARRYLDDEQLSRQEQISVLKEIFNANVRETEIERITLHFAPLLKDDHPVHLSILGKTGTGKTATVLFMLNHIRKIAADKGIPIRYERLDLTTPKTCFRALNDIACMLNVSRRYKKGVSLDELMNRIEEGLSTFEGYFILLIDEIDHVKTDPDTFLKFLVRRLPQSVNAKLILVFVSNRLNWIDHLDPRIKSFLKVNELVFKPYDATDLTRILNLRIQKALIPSMLAEGVVQKISAISSQHHGDARKAVELLSKSAHLAERDGTKIEIETVDKALNEIETDHYQAIIKNSPKQLQTVLLSIINISHLDKISTGDAFLSYKKLCRVIGLHELTQRAFSDLILELDMYGFITAQTISRGRYGRTKQISLAVSDAITEKLKSMVLLG